ncbi:MAG TPA: winged helix-turn-helix domain-containing protein [Candidatus Limnocylindrales bacterium]|nr:winged helix-turn-helix domain-containing protein [Candidatus Limnocylindrales bacterium]
MRRSKLEISLDILEVFVNCGPIRLTRVSLKAKVSYILLKQITKGFLTDGLVEERKVKDYLVYTATPKGRMVLSQLREDSQSNRNLEQCLLWK